MEYIKVAQAAEKWGISPRRVRVLCVQGKIDGVIRKGKLYMIPENAAKPADGRKGQSSLLLDNTIQGFKIGNRWKIPKESVVEFIRFA